MRFISVCAFLFCFFFVSATSNAIGVQPDANQPVEFLVVGNQVKAQINVLGLFQATLQITFENVMGLNQNALNITASQILPNDVLLLRRFPHISQINVPLQLPVLINITHSATSTLTFTGPYEIELYTHNLTFSPVLRLFKAPNSGTFHDISTFSGMGSYRVRGTSGDFSDFLILIDLRGSNTVIQYKMDVLQQTLVSNASRIEAGFYQTMQNQLDTARASWQAGQNSQAVSYLEMIISSIKLDNGISMPNTYRANDPNTINVAGALRAHAATLIFSLNQ